MGRPEIGPGSNFGLRLWVSTVAKSCDFVLFNLPILPASLALAVACDSGLNLSNRGVQPLHWTVNCKVKLAQSKGITLPTAKLDLRLSFLADGIFQFERQNLEIRLRRH